MTRDPRILATVRVTYTEDRRHGPILLPLELWSELKIGDAVIVTTDTGSTGGGKIIRDTGSAKGCPRVHLEWPLDGDARRATVRRRSAPSAPAADVEPATLGAHRTALVGA